MTNGQINKANAYQATNLVLTDPVFQAIWSGLPAFARGQAGLAGSINLLAALAQAQGTPLTGITLARSASSSRSSAVSSSSLEPPEPSPSRREIKPPPPSSTSRKEPSKTCAKPSSMTPPN